MDSLHDQLLKDMLATMQMLGHYRESDVRGAGSSPLGGEGLIHLLTLTLEHYHTPQY
jgi:hypothetical protein